MPQSPRRASLRPFVRMAMAVCAVIMAHHVASRATRDTLFLTNFPVRLLPMMVAAAAALSVAAALLATRAIARMGPVALLRGAFAASAALTLVEWAFLGRESGVVSIVLYAHVVALGPVVLGGFWSLVNERLDPRTSKRAVGWVAGFGTLGGLAGGVIVERATTWLGVGAAFPVLALAHAACAWAVGPLAAAGARSAGAAAGTGSAAARGATAGALSLGEGARRILATPYLQNLALLVFGTALCSGLLDYVFKAQASYAMGESAGLMRLFSAFYAGVALLTFVAQTFLSRPMLERAGLAATMGALPVAVVGGSACAAVVTNAWTVSGVRAAEAVLEGSFYRAGSEQLYAPIPPLEKRGTRMLIEIVCDRAGEIAGMGLIALVLVAAPIHAQTQLLWITVPCAALMLLVVGRVRAGYVASLEAGLRAGRVHLDSTLATDLTTMQTLRVALESGAVAPGTTRASRATPPPAADAETLVALLRDPHTDFDTRRRIPALLLRMPSPVAAEGLIHGLDDPRFEVRYRSGRALARMVEADPSLAPDADTVLDAVRRECALGRRIWESQRMLDQLDEPVEDALAGAFVRERSGRSLEHVFTLLSLVLPREPLRIAYRGLHAEDRVLRGTALEYLDTVLPPDVHEVLWPHLEPESPKSRARARARAQEPRRDRAQVLDDLMRSNQSIELNLDELRRREGR